MFTLTKYSAFKSARALAAAGICLAAPLVSSVPVFADDSGWSFDGHHFSNQKNHDSGPANQGHRDRVGAVFYILLENHNFTQPASDTSAPHQLFGSPAAPFLNSLITPGHPNARDASFATAYHNVLATQSGNNPHIHPSEPNYIWQEAGSNLGVLNDADPYGTGNSVAAIAAFWPIILA